MFKKLRYWIIKKLGGYTEPMPTNLPLLNNSDFNVARTTLKPVVLRAKAIQRGIEREIPEEMFREDVLLPQIAESVLPYVTFTKRDCFEFGGIEHCAEIKILSEQEAAENLLEQRKNEWLRKEGKQQIKETLENNKSRIADI